VDWRQPGAAQSMVGAMSVFFAFLDYYDATNLEINACHKVYFVNKN
jgi:hypothetical protein